MKCYTALRNTLVNIVCVIPSYKEISEKWITKLHLSLITKKKKKKSCSINEYNKKHILMQNYKQKYEIKNEKNLECIWKIK